MSALYAYTERLREISRLVTDYEPSEVAWRLCSAASTIDRLQCDRRELEERCETLSELVSGLLRLMELVESGHQCDRCKFCEKCSGQPYKSDCMMYEVLRRRAKALGIGVDE